MEIQLPRLPIRALYVFAVVAITIFALPFVWYIMHISFGAFQTIGSQMIIDFGTNSTQSDQIEVFFGYTDQYILVLGLVGLALWAFVYSQKKGEPVYEY